MSTIVSRRPKAGECQGQVLVPACGWGREVVGGCGTRGRRREWRM